MTTLALLSVIAFAAAGAPADSPTDPPPIRLALYDLQVESVPPHITRVVTDSLTVELRKLQRVSVISVEEVRAMLDMEAQKQAVGCGDDSCLSEIADALGVDGLVVGSLARIGDEHVIGLRRIDQRSAQAVGQVSRRLVAGDGEEFLAAIGPIVEELFPEYPLRPGTTRGVDEKVALRLSPPPLPAWSFWTATGVTSVFAAATVTSFMWWGLARADYVSYGDAGVQEGRVLDGAEVKRKASNIELAGYTTYGLGTVAVLVAVVAAVSIPFVDWEGYGDEEG